MDVLQRCSAVSVPRPLVALGGTGYRVHHQQELGLLSAGLRWARSLTSNVYFTQKLHLESRDGFSLRSVAALRSPTGCAHCSQQQGKYFSMGRSKTHDCFIFNKLKVSHTEVCEKSMSFSKQGGVLKALS